MVIDYDNNGARRHSKANADQLISLLALRLKDLRDCVIRIEGIDRRLHELDVRVPVRLPPLPDYGRITEAVFDIYDWKEVRPDGKGRKRTRASHNRASQ
jgi:hypothetical protein